MIVACIRACRSAYELSLLEPAVASSNSDSEFEPGGVTRRKNKRSTASSDFIRMTSRRKGVVSYKESSHSDLSGDSGEGGEGRGGEGIVAEEDSREAIERVIKCRLRSESVVVG